MFAENLMIGDWVKLSNVKGFSGDYCKIVEIDSRIISSFIVKVFHPGFGELNLSVKELDIEPIEITSDILSNSGWSIDNGYATRNILGDVYFEYYMFEGIFRRFYKNKQGKEEMLFVCPGISYIHELQHAARLCNCDFGFNLI